MSDDFEPKFVHVFLRARNEEQYAPRFRRWMRELHHAFVVATSGAHYADSIDDALELASDLRADYAVIHRPTNVVFDLWHLDEMLFKALRGRACMAARPTDPHGRPAYGCFVVQMSEYFRAGAPAIPHERAIPLELLPEGSAVATWYLNPEVDAERALDLLERIQTVSQEEIYHLPSRAWQETLSNIRDLHQGVESVLFIMNTEHLDSGRPSLDFGPVRNFYALASGLKPYYLLSQIQAAPDATLTIYDVSAAALDFHRQLRARWDGRALPQFLARASTSEDPADRELRELLWRSSDFRRGAALDSRWKEMLERVGGEEAVAALWRRVRAMPVEFVRLDLLNGFRELRVESRPGRSFLWFSHVFEYADTLLVQGGVDAVTAKFRAFVDHLARANGDFHLLGKIAHHPMQVGPLAKWRALAEEIPARAHRESPFGPVPGPDFQDPVEKDAALR